VPSSIHLFPSKPFRCVPTCPFIVGDLEAIQTPLVADADRIKTATEESFISLSGKYAVIGRKLHGGMQLQPIAAAMIALTAGDCR
jgi:ABC-type Fe2+-enterobactin transport system substrate-binding protein